MDNGCDRCTDECLGMCRYLSLPFYELVSGNKIKKKEQINTTIKYKHDV